MKDAYMEVMLPLMGERAAKQLEQTRALTGAAPDGSTPPSLSRWKRPPIHPNESMQTTPSITAEKMGQAATTGKQANSRHQKPPHQKPPHQKPPHQKPQPEAATDSN